MAYTVSDVTTPCAVFREGFLLLVGFSCHDVTNLAVTVGFLLLFVGDVKSIPKPRDQVHSRTYIPLECPLNPHKPEPSPSRRRAPHSQCASTESISHEHPRQDRAHAQAAACEVRQNARRCGHRASGHRRGGGSVMRSRLSGRTSHRCAGGICAAVHGSRGVRLRGCGLWAVRCAALR